LSSSFRGEPHLVQYGIFSPHAANDGRILKNIAELTAVYLLVKTSLFSAYLTCAKRKG
jgi:hypothetical protein